MGQAKEVNEEAILGRFRQLSPDERKEALDFLDFLAYRVNVRRWIEFDEWALNLAKNRGFSNLTEEDVARIVDDFRSGK
jgi:hypothetical protein